MLCKGQINDTVWKQVHKIRLQQALKNVFIPKSKHDLVLGNFISNETYCVHSY